MSQIKLSLFFKWVGRVFLTLNIVRLFLPALSPLWSAVLNTLLILGFVFDYEDLWKVIKITNSIRIKWKKIAETETYAKFWFWLLVIILPILGIGLVFLSFYYPAEDGTHILGTCMGVFALVSWLLMLRFSKFTSDINSPSKE